MKLVQGTGGFHLAEPQSFQDLSVHVDTPGALQELGDWGRPDGDYVWLASPQLCAAGLQTTEDAAAWLHGFADMIRYARDRGWADASGRSIRAHVEYHSSAQDGWMKG